MLFVALSSLLVLGFAASVEAIGGGPTLLRKCVVEWREIKAHPKPAPGAYPRQPTLAVIAALISLAFWMLVALYNGP